MDRVAMGDRVIVAATVLAHAENPNSPIVHAEVIEASADGAHGYVRIFGEPGPELAGMNLRARQMMIASRRRVFFHASELEIDENPPEENAHA
jgi:hypothetical protein